MLPDNERETLRRAWAIEPAPNDLAARITRHALAQPQRRPFLARVIAWVALPPRHAAFSGLALAACLALLVLVMERNATTTQTHADGTTTKYVKPMDQIIEQMIWNDYSY